MNQKVHLSLPNFKLSKEFLEDNFNLNIQGDQSNNWPTRKASCNLGYFAPKQKFLQSFTTPTPLSLNSNKKKITEKFTLSEPETDTDSSMIEVRGNEIRKEMKNIKKQSIPKVISCNKLFNNDISEDEMNSELDFSENCNDESIFIKCKKEIKMEKEPCTNLLFRNTTINNTQRKSVSILQILQCF